MAQPTRCDGREDRWRLSHNNLRRKQWRRRQRAERRRLLRSGSSSNAFRGARMEHPFFSSSLPAVQVAALPKRTARSEEPAKRDGQRPGRRARRQSAPGRRANGSQSTTTERGDYRWRRRLKAARRRRRRSVNFRRFRHKGDVHNLCVPFFYCLNAGSGGGVSPSQIVTLRTTSHVPRRSTTSIPSTTWPNTV
jgi:hypothetical protein